MSENKEYVSRSDELGNIHISEDVLSAVAASAGWDTETRDGKTIFTKYGEADTLSLRCSEEIVP